MSPPSNQAASSVLRERIRRKYGMLSVLLLYSDAVNVALGCIASPFDMRYLVGFGLGLALASFTIGSSHVYMHRML